ncbi:uncharacterized protein LOC110920911 isoform X2 [Helianthus annuus]|nr:uncharacterized protein LOC110920911 isoform X2 [Helianthus annuus]
MLEHVYLSKKGLKSGDSLLFVRCGRRMSHRKFGYPSHSPVDFFPGSVLLTTKKKIVDGAAIYLSVFLCFCFARYGLHTSILKLLLNSTQEHIKAAVSIFH